MEDRPLEDRQLLQRFVKDNSQEAFAALTARYLNLVYAVCRRELGDADAAEDVTQAVFLILARKAPSLGRNVVLSGWLFQTARFTAKNARLTAQRRAAYEQKAAEALMEQQTEIERRAEDEQWTEIEPLLNQSLAALKAADRDCLLLRFFQGASFAEVGTSLGLSEDAARKRVTRSLDKMRQFFTKNGVIIPAIALPVLLTAHAAKAAPANCQAGIAKLSAGVLAGHTTAALTGSHAYQLSEGVLKAMKISQMKVAIGITATTVAISFSAYAIAHGMTLIPTKTPQIAVSTFVALPGHVLKPVAGGTAPTAIQIAERCKSAYTALASYQITSSVVSHGVAAANLPPHIYNTFATIQFVKPGKIRAEGTDMSGQPFAYISDGVGTEETDMTQEGRWQKRTPEMAIASVTGIALSAATTIPSLLLHTISGSPLPLTIGKTLSPEVREETLNGQTCYVLTAHLESSEVTETTSLWIDEKTYLLRRSVSDFNTASQTRQIGGEQQTIPGMKMHTVEQFTNERLNEPIPDSAFTLPAVK